MTNSPAAHGKIAQNLPAAWRQSPDFYLRRAWLCGGAEREAMEQVVRAGAPDTVLTPILERLLTEGSANALWQLPLTPKNYRYPAALTRLGLRSRVANAVPWAIHLQVLVAYDETARKGKSFEYGRRLEELCWQNLTAVHEAEVFCRYMGAHAYDAAKRFYDAIVPFVTETVGFSNNGAPARFILAWWESDDATMRRAMSDGATYSWRDLMTQATYALHRDDLPGAEKMIDALIQRYGDEDGVIARLKAYLPLVPALKDPKHPQHEKAVTSFPAYGSWQSTQFVLARDAKLSPEEAVRFFAGLQDTAWGKMAVAYIQRDKVAFERHYSGGGSDGNNASAILAELMRNELLETPPKTDVPDIKPADARPLPLTLADLRRKTESAEIAAALDLSKYKTANELWALVQKLKEPPTERPRSRDDMQKMLRRWLENQNLAATGFLKAWPNDRRRWEARIIVLGVNAQLGQLSGRAPDATALQREIDAILAAPDATPAAKGEAAYYRLMDKTREVNPAAPHTFAAFHRIAEEYLANYGSHARAEEVARMQIQLVEMRDQPGADNILKKLATHANESIATTAKETIAGRERVSSLRAKPLDLKMPATDGSEIDFAKLRGKVVLLDFWASWCGPCMVEMPAVVKAYTQLRGKGFEIVGVSLDQESEAMDAALKKTGATWPQHFDGTGWQNKIARQFAVRAIPSVWLFDKKGLLRETGLSGEELTAAVEKLLRE